MSFSFPDGVRSFPCPVPFLCNMLCRLPEKKKSSQIAYFTCPFPFPVPFLCVAFLFLVLFFVFLSNMLFGRPGKSIFTNCIPSLAFPFLFLFVAFSCFSVISFPFCSFHVLSFQFILLSLFLLFLLSCPVLSIVWSCLVSLSLPFFTPLRNLCLTEPKRTVNRTESP